MYKIKLKGYSRNPRDRITILKELIKVQRNINECKEQIIYLEMELNDTKNKYPKMNQELLNTVLEITDPKFKGTKYMYDNTYKDFVDKLKETFGGK